MADTADKARVSILLSSSRVASLSDTMFGVAMTLVVTTLLPTIQANRGSALDLFRAMGGELISVVLSFAIAARYWVSQQQRLAATRSVTPLQIRLNIAFLFLIVLVPITTSLTGLTGAGARVDSVAIYGTHLLLIALVNLLLWIAVHRTAGAPVQVVRSWAALALFVLALAVGAIRPALAIYVWTAVFAVPLLVRHPRSLDGGPAGSAGRRLRHAARRVVHSLKT
jgi:uncharacterized membrane protein